MPRLLDAYCHAGGAAAGYQLAGFTVVGIDIQPMSGQYPFEFIEGDAIEYIQQHGHEYDMIHASPPCQLYSKAQRLRGREHPDLLAPTRSALNNTGKPWVIENVPGAPLRHPVKLCGAMFGLRTYRHRLFETGGGFSLEQPEHPKHVARNAKMGRQVRDGEFIYIVGNFTNVPLAREIMGMPWATREGLREAIPPVYTQYIGARALEAMTGR